MTDYNNSDDYRHDTGLHAPAGLGSTVYFGFPDKPALKCSGTVTIDTDEDAAALEAMPFPLTVWRAYDAEPDPGISWTLDEQWCRGYAQAKGRRVKQMQVSRDQVFAYVSRRGEEEVIVL